MYAFQVTHNKIRKIKVLGKTPFGFRVRGPVALWPSARNTFLLKRDAIAYLQAGGTAAARVPITTTRGRP
jgi:hypothetical protein